VRVTPPPAPVSSPAGYRGRDGLAVGVALALVGDGTGAGAPVLVGDGTAAVALGATGAGALHPDLPAGLAVGVPGPFPVAAVGVATPGVAVSWPAGAVLATGRLGTGLLGTVLAELARADAAEPEPDAAAEHPARAKPAAIPSVQPAATRANSLCDRTCMLLEVVPGKDTNTGKYVGTRRKLCPAGSNLSPRPSV
jgi:hypothetical protein